MKKRSITVRYNEEGIPYITPKSGCYLSFQISSIGGEIEILGNEIGLQLLARSILGIAKMEEESVSKYPFTHKQKVPILCFQALLLHGNFVSL